MGRGNYPANNKLISKRNEEMKQIYHIKINIIRK